MSTDLDTPGFDVDVTLVNGSMAFGFDRPAEVARFIDFVKRNPDHVFTGDGMRYSCTLLTERYIDTGRYREPLGADDLTEALRDCGWLRTDDDGIERLHGWRPEG